MDCSKTSVRLRSRRSGKGAFTLVEMMVAIGIVGLVLAAAFSNVGGSLRTMETARDYTRVAQILQSELEDVRTMSWADLEVLQAATGGDWEVLDISEEFHRAFGTRYTTHRRVQNRDALPDQKEIVIKVEWTNAHGVTVTKYAASWFTENGLHDYFYRSF